MSRSSRSRKRPQPIKATNGRHASSSTALLERTPVLIPLDNEIRPILEARRGNKGGRNGTPRSFSYAWDETEALGITADMRRSGPGMLSDQDRKDTLYKAYLNSVWISACVDVIAKRITSGGMVIEETEQGGGTDAEKKVLHDFLHYINDDDDFLQLIRSVATDLLIYGECYMEIVKQNGKPYSLHKIDCITMNYQLDKHGNIVKYIQNMTHSTTAIKFQPDEVIRWWFPDPRASKKALSPIERIMGSIDADVHMADWVRSFFRKGARPNFWIQFEGSKDEATRFVTWLRENYTGMANAHVPLVLYDNAKLNEIGKGSVDIDFLEGRKHMCKEILAGYQVPPALVGLIESGNIGGGTGESQEKSFLHNACDPLRQLIFEKFNYRITGQGFGINGWRVNTRYAEYRSDDLISKVNDTAIRNGSSTVNEVRADQGKNPVDGGDESVIVASRDIVPVARLKQLSNEQAQSAQLDIETKQAQVDKIKNPPAPPVAVVPPQQNNQQQNTPPTKEEPQESAIAALERSINHVIEGNIRIIESIMSAKSVSELSEDDQLLQSMRAYDAVMAEEKAQFHTHDINKKPVIQPIKEEAKQTGMMLAFMLDDDTSQQLAIPGGEPASELHITLAYLGDMEKEPQDDMLRPHTSPDKIKDTIALVAQDESPISGTIGGLGRFTPEGEGQDPIIALVDVPGLAELRTRLVGAIEGAGYFVADNHGFTPHCTLAYVDKDAPMPVESVPSLPLNFDTVWLCIGDERIPFKLSLPTLPDKESHNGQDKPQTQENSEEVQSNAQETAGTGSDLGMPTSESDKEILIVSPPQEVGGTTLPILTQNVNVRSLLDTALNDIISGKIDKLHHYATQEEYHEEHLSQQATNPQSSEEDVALLQGENESQSDESVHQAQETDERDGSDDYRSSSSLTVQESISDKQKSELASYIADLFNAMKHRASSQQITRANAKDAYKLNEHDRTALASKILGAYNTAYDYAYKRDLATVGLTRESFRSKIKDVAQWAIEQVDSIAATFEEQLGNFVDWLSDTVEDVASEISDWMERYLGWKPEQIANFTLSSGMNDGAREAIDEILDNLANAGIDTTGISSSSGKIRVRVVPEESSSDWCKEWAGQSVPIEDSSSLPYFPAHPNCIHSIEVYMAEGDE